MVIKAKFASDFVIFVFITKKINLMVKQFEQISLNLLKKLNEEVLKLRCASKFHLVYKTLIMLFLTRAILDETSFIVFTTKELANTKKEFLKSVHWEDTGTDVRKFNSEMNLLFHEFVRLGNHFFVDGDYKEDMTKVDEIWLELRKMHDYLIAKEFRKEIVN